MTDQAVQSPTVHLIFSSRGLEFARVRSAPNDTWVLIGDGVYAISQLTEQPASAPEIQVMIADATQRGVTVPTAASQLKPIDDVALVGLIAQSGRTVSWQ